MPFPLKRFAERVFGPGPWLLLALAAPVLTGCHDESTGCCLICAGQCACGNTCIDCSLKCTQASGCACNSSPAPAAVAGHPAFSAPDGGR